MTSWVLRHRTIGSWFHALLHGGRRWWRFRYIQYGGCYLCRSLHMAEEREPGWVERSAKDAADYAAGRYYRRSGEDWVPNPDWPKDGEQPT